MEVRPENKILEKYKWNEITKLEPLTCYKLQFYFFLKLGIEILENVQLWLIYSIDFASNVEQI